MSISPISKRQREDDYTTTPCTSTRIADIVDARLAKFTESLAEMIRSSEARIVAQFNSSVESLKLECGTLKARIDVVEVAVNEVATLQSEVGALRGMVCHLENLAVASELRIRGIPMAKAENLSDIFDTFCKKLEIPTPTVRHMHRINVSNNNRIPDVLVRLDSFVDRNNLLRAVAIYKRANKLSDLRLSHLGIHCDGDGPVFINENLIKSNYNILKAALTLKKDKLLWSAYCHRGIVHVKKFKEDTVAIRLDDMSKLIAMERELRAFDRAAKIKGTQSGIAATVNGNNNTTNFRK